MGTDCCCWDPGMPGVDGDPVLFVGVPGVCCGVPGESCVSVSRYCVLYFTSPRQGKKSEK